MRTWNVDTAPGITMRGVTDAIKACRALDVYAAIDLTSFAFDALSVLAPESITWPEFAQGQARFWLLRQAMVTRVEAQTMCDVLEQTAVSLDALRARLRQHLDDRATVAEMEQQLTKEDR
jgi:hypothetical protein